MISLGHVIDVLKDRWNQSRLRVTYRIRPMQPMVRLGSDYGGWSLPDGILNEDSIVYCAGVGEDVSFDLAVIERCGCDVYAFDPTPRSIEYVRRIASDEARFKFVPVGVWSEDTTLRFFEPKDPAHVSHSILNLQDTEGYFEAPVRSITSIMDDLGHDRIDLLKLNIEGAEHAVIDFLLDHSITPKLLLVVFDRPMPHNIVKEKIQSLTSVGYQIAAVKHWSFTFVLKSSG